jgi:transcriptional regulator with XRE-family HTH domain
MRNERGLSQQRLADLAGVNKVTLIRIEHGTGNPNVETLEKLARALDIEMADFFPKVEPSLFDNNERRRATEAWNQGAKKGTPVEGIWIEFPPGPARDMILRKLQEIAEDVEDEEISQRLNHVVVDVAEQVGDRDVVST